MENSILCNVLSNDDICDSFASVAPIPALRQLFAVSKWAGSCVAKLAYLRIDEFWQQNILYPRWRWSAYLLFELVYFRWVEIKLMLDNILIKEDGSDSDEEIVFVAAYHGITSDVMYDKYYLAMLYGLLYGKVEFSFALNENKVSKYGIGSILSNIDDIQYVVNIVKKHDLSNQVSSIIHGAISNKNLNIIKSLIHEFHEYIPFEDKINIFEELLELMDPSIIEEYRSILDPHNWSNKIGAVNVEMLEHLNKRGDLKKAYIFQQNHHYYFMRHQYTEIKWLIKNGYDLMHSTTTKKEFIDNNWDRFAEYFNTGDEEIVNCTIAALGQSIIRKLEKAGCANELAALGQYLIDTAKSNTK